ncbi:MAG: hypothetical protein IJ464_03830 [Alistipes sp.]|nr:hypothetical protein [Alistipes sp.]
MKNLFMYLMLWILAFNLVSCDDNNNNPVQPNGDSNLWGTTYYHANLGAYPDIYSKYWVYAYNITENPNIGLRLTGAYPEARFFSFSIYNDLKGEVIDGLDDVNISPDDGSINPYTVTTNSTNNKFTIYIVKEGTDISLLKNANAENVCYFNDVVECMSICLRQYLGEGEYGGVDLPTIEGVDLTTGAIVDAPKAVVSMATIMKDGNFVPLASDQSTEVPFLLSPRGEYFPNNSTDYLYCRTQLTTDDVLTFSFIPAPIPTCVEEYRGAKARYWSICIGSVMNTYSYCSFYDRMLEYKDGEKITVAIISANNAKLADVKKAMENIPYSYLMEWDEERLDNQGRKISDIITVLYRNILPDTTWQYSMSTMTPTPYGDPYNSITDPDKQVAHRALGNYAPLGKKHKTDEFLQLYKDTNPSR